MYHLRWMNRQDMKEIINIEQKSFDSPWPEEDFIRVLRNRNAIGMSLENGNKISGYIIYELLPHSINIVNFAVYPTHQGLGTLIINKIKEKLRPERRNKITLAVRDGNLPTHLFLRKNEFQAVSVLRNYYDTGEDAYQFVYRLPVNENSQPNPRTNQNIAV